MKRFKIFLLLLIIIAICCAVVGCNQESEGQNSGTEGEPVAKIVIDKTEIKLVFGESATIKAQTLTKGAKVTWSSSNPAICTVENGVLTTHALGLVEISATCEGETASCMVEIISLEQGNMEGYSLTLNRSSVKMRVGSEFDVIATLESLNTQVSDVKFAYESSDTKIATVDKNGKIKAIGEGECIVEVKYESGSNWISASLIVKVVGDYSVRILPFDDIINVGESVTVKYEVYKGGELVSYPQDKTIISVTDLVSDTNVARLEGAKLKGIDVGVAKLTVELADADVKATYDFAVIPVNPAPINLSLSDIEIYLGSTVEIEVGGATWGHLGYSVSGDNFVVEDGKIYAKSEGEGEITVTHLETKQSVTAKLYTKVFDNCITTAEQFMNLSAATEDCYLGADIDLSAEEWKYKLGFYVGVNSPEAKVAYLVESLKVNLDGRGHKVTVRYDHEIDDNNTWVGGIFHSTSGKDSANIVIENLVVDFEAKYYAPEESRDNPASIGVMNSVITLNAYKTQINNCFFGVRMYADNYVNRETITGNLVGAGMKNCIVDIAVYLKDKFQPNVGTIAWNGGNKNVSDTTIIHNSDKVYTGSLNGGSYYGSRDEFISAWKSSLVVNQSTYTAWKVEENKIYLADREVDLSLPVVESTSIKITTAEEFMKLSTYTKDCYLAADIDLSAEQWKYKVGFFTQTNSPEAKVAYLIESLNVNLDGRGHKVTVRYDHEIDDNNTWVGGIFFKTAGSTVNITIENLVIDFEAKYYGPTEELTNKPSLGIMNSVITLDAHKTQINNCYIKARMYADNFVKRETVVANLVGAGMKNCIVDIAVYKNGVFQTGVGTIAWNNGNKNVSNTTIIHNSTGEYTGSLVDGSYYSSKAEFITAWNSMSVVKQSTYTAWMISGSKIYLNGKEVKL